MLSCLWAIPLAGCDAPPLPPPPTFREDSSSSSAAVMTNVIGLQLQLIPAGEFLMGSPRPEQLGPYSACESAERRVRLERSFRISRHEVTVGQFRQFVAAAGYTTEAELTGRGCNGLDVATGQVVRRPDCLWSSPGFPQTDQHPVVCVSWQDAQAFCDWLSQTTGDHYRLPTEMEWEYCCRAGRAGMFSCGDDAQQLQQIANCGDRALARQFPDLTGTAGWDDGHTFTAAVGSFAPNAFGLHDMHGNVGEWCQDWFQPDTPPDAASPEATTRWRVVRGGSWYNTPVSCRSSGRHDCIPTAASTTNGFRVVLD